jgi:hypothetical protein
MDSLLVLPRRTSVKEIEFCCASQINKILELTPSSLCPHFFGLQRGPHGRGGRSVINIIIIIPKEESKGKKSIPVSTPCP